MYTLHLVNNGFLYCSAISSRPFIINHHYCYYYYCCIKLIEQIIKCYTHLLHCIHHKASVKNVASHKATDATLEARSHASLSVDILEVWNTTQVQRLYQVQAHEATFTHPDQSLPTIHHHSSCIGREGERERVGK